MTETYQGLVGGGKLNHLFSLLNVCHVAHRHVLKGSWELFYISTCVQFPQ